MPSPSRYRWPVRFIADDPFNPYSRDYGFAERYDRPVSVAADSVPSPERDPVPADSHPVSERLRGTVVDDLSTVDWARLVQSIDEPTVILTRDPSDRVDVESYRYSVGRWFMDSLILETGPDVAPKVEAPHETMDSIHSITDDDLANVDRRCRRASSYMYNTTARERREMAVKGYMLAENFQAAAETAKEWGWKRRRKRAQGDFFFVDHEGNTIAYSEAAWLSVQTLRDLHIYLGKGYKNDPYFKQSLVARLRTRGAIIHGMGRAKKDGKFILPAQEREVVAVAA